MLPLFAMAPLGACGDDGSAADLRFSGESFTSGVTIEADSSQTSLRLALDDDTGMYIGGAPDGVTVTVKDLDGIERGSSIYDDDDDVMLYTSEGGAVTVEFGRAVDSADQIVFEARFNECMNMVDGDGELGVCT